MDDRFFLQSLPVLQRFALSYAPAAARVPTLALLAFDTRLAAVVRSASAPMLAQLRIAWWRDRLGDDPARWPAGEPLFALLARSGIPVAALIGLADAWEEMSGDAPLDPRVPEALAEARAQAFSVLATALGHGASAEKARRLARGWALADLAAHLRDPAERGAVDAAMTAHDWSAARLPRDLRPVVVLHGLAARCAKRGSNLNDPRAGTLAAAMRLGLLGR